MDEWMVKFHDDFPDWRTEYSDAGTGFWSAHLGEGDDARHVASPTTDGLYRLVASQPEDPGQTVGDLMADAASAGF